MDACLIPALREQRVPAPLMVPGSVVPALLVTVAMVFNAKILMRSEGLSSCLWPLSFNKKRTKH